MPARAFLSNISLDFFAFSIEKIVMWEQQLCQAGYMYLFSFFIYKNCNLRAVVLAPVHFGCTSVFSLEQWQKMQCWGSSFVKPVICICFCFHSYKNYNAVAVNSVASQIAHTCFYLIACIKTLYATGVAMPLASQVTLICFHFPLGKIITGRQLCHQLVKPVVRIYFSISVCKKT